MPEATSHRECGTMCVHRRLLNDVPQYLEARRRIEDHALQSQMRLQTHRAGIRRIPVVVHVIYNSPTENVSQEQVDSQIDVLNRDFRMTNPDIGQVPAAFQPVVGDARIEFYLATTDPDGNATNGVTRTQTSLAAFDADDSMKFTTSEGQDAWPGDRYLNMWVCKLDGGILGYAQFPGGPMATDGVVITHTAFGTTGTAQAPFDKGRTGTHEIGHWLNLYHIWGDDGQGCSGSDNVADTPNQGGPNYNVPSFPTISCGNGPNGDMFMNYMDYVDDAAMVMFTQGQISRMMATLDFDGPRASIGETVPEVTVPQNAVLIAYYQNILMYFFFLHQRGLLDYQGYMSWQNAYASYQQLTAA